MAGRIWGFRLGPQQIEMIEELGFLILNGALNLVVILLKQHPGNGESFDCKELWESLMPAIPLQQQYGRGREADVKPPLLLLLHKSGRMGRGGGLGE